MAYQIPHKAEFEIDPTSEEYTAAALLAERQGGALQALPWVIVLAAGLLFLGLSSFGWFRTNYTVIIMPLMICLLCPFLLIVFFGILPAILKKRATEDYKTYAALMNPATVRLYADNAVTKADRLTLTDPYALMSGCIETPEMLVLIKDRERMLIIPKRCLPPEQAEEIISFLRTVFTRRRRVRKNWVF
ncbi:MAG: YcxB family protein [Oscillospiraceae bacterium]|nr:YcxB family protein [Oscillospiraceae bacterium]MDD4413235.1 YcxB family protein [Oscillospiraceae bacterium]